MAERPTIARDGEGGRGQGWPKGRPLRQSCSNISGKVIVGPSQGEEGCCHGRRSGCYERQISTTEVISSPVPVVADFWAEWCGPCKMIAPILKDLAAEYKDKLKVAKIDVDQEPELASQFNIVSIPTLLFFNKGQVVKQQIGAVPRHALEKIIKDMIA